MERASSQEKKEERYWAFVVGMYHAKLFAGTKNGDIDEDDKRGGLRCESVENARGNKKDCNANATGTRRPA
jgi:hypothetical protein